MSLIYCCHALEYFDRHMVIEVLKKWHKALEQGAALRLAVPNFEAAK